MLLNNEELKQLTITKHNLIRSYDKKEINEKTYEIEIEKINDKINKCKQQFLDTFETTKIVEIKKVMREKKMESEKKKSVSVGKKIKTGSKVDLISQGLMRKSLKTPTEVAEWVKERKPEEDLAKLVGYVKTLVKEISGCKKPRWKDYTWDNEKYLLIKNE